MDRKAPVTEDTPTARHPPRQAPGTGSTIGRGIEIAFRICSYLAWFLAWRLSLVRQPTPAQRFARLLEDLGTSFTKLGQHLSLRSDLFPPEYIEGLEKLEDQEKPFPPEGAVAALRRPFGQPPTQLFIRFDAQPLAAASVAQVHTARTFSGKEVV